VLDLGREVNVRRLAFVTDLHADVHALRDALVQIDRMGCELTVCAGDLVDYGLFPEETLALLRERRIPTIRGNHDRWALGRGSADDPNGVSSAVVHDASGWDLSPASTAFLENLPTSWRATLEGVRVAVHHARPGSDMAGIYPDASTQVELSAWLDEADADVLIVGHTHLAFCMEADGRGIVANPGALLRESAERTEAPWLFDRVTGTFNRTPERGGGTFGVLELPSKVFRVYRAADRSEVPISGQGGGHSVVYLPPGTPA
jgi:predicted phosphodiesterase